VGKPECLFNNMLRLPRRTNHYILCFSLDCDPPPAYPSRVAPNDESRLSRDARRPKTPVRQPRDTHQSIGCSRTRRSYRDGDPDDMQPPTDALIRMVISVRWIG
jgi:hypothetical protein